MSTIRVSGVGSEAERLRRLEEATNFGEQIFGFALTPIDVTIAATTNTVVGGITIPWIDLRTFLPDQTHRLWLSGWSTSPVNLVLTPAYQRDDEVLVPLAEATVPASAGWKKFHIGPYEMRGPIANGVLGVPKNEDIHALNILGKQGVAGAAGHVSRCTLWLKFSARRA